MLNNNVPKVSAGQLADNFDKIRKLAYIVDLICDLYLRDLSDEDAKTIGETYTPVLIPILNEDVLSHIKLLNESDWNHFYVLLSSVGVGFDLNLDVIGNDPIDTPTMSDYPTPCILSIAKYDSTYDDDPPSYDDDDDPIGEEIEPVKTMAVAAGSGR